jgi:hypothetical protein
MPVIEYSTHPPHHRMLTIGTDRAGLRVTMGRLDRQGRFHRRQPCVFLLWRGRRV